MNPNLNVLCFGLLGYLSGSLAFAVWITRLKTGTDLRTSGSRHATATNAIRQAGWGTGLLVAVLDLCKGFLPTYLAARYGSVDWVIPAAAAMAVVGHCWPLFAKFRGGMGLATAGGALLAISPASFGVGLAVLVLLVLAIRHAARASALAGLAIPVVLWGLAFPAPAVWTALAVGAIISARFLVDWNRMYRELWLDRPGID